MELLLPTSLRLSSFIHNNLLIIKIYSFIIFSLTILFSYVFQINSPSSQKFIIRGFSHEIADDNSECLDSLALLL
ncbi:hypothetical protein LEP1GSC058_1401 [Leptospira fainei serovar Hurstbridge str. BUT 6]|uniref:Uncharacterized protein n=1 Tax=Leptospira fainei serovar Hurstbridge str. BUT 6 TaxID=1193011 RepID=S3V0P7_9LEPT|nr:hypothetical protein LEP1GSC058_1401 [Leptospira fainei serovar Hurstbridge str. BUT 6]